MTRSRICHLLSIALLCHGLGGQQEAAQGKATIYIHRLRIFAGSARRMTLSLDQEPFAHLQNGRYFAITLPRGEHTLADKNPKDYIRFSVEANKVYYVHAEWAENGGLKFNARFSIPDPETGAADVRRLKPSDDSQIENHKIAFLTHRPK